MENTMQEELPTSQNDIDASSVSTESELVDSSDDETELQVDYSNFQF